MLPPGCGCGLRPAFPAPSLRREDNEIAELGQIMPREYIRLSSPGLTGRSSIPETAVIESTGRGVLDPPHSRGMTSRECGGEGKFASPIGTTSAPATFPSQARLNHERAVQHAFISARRNLFRITRDWRRKDKWNAGNFSNSLLVSSQAPPPLPRVRTPHR